MGTALSVLREQEAKQEAQAKEQLAMLEKMAQAQLASKVDEILHGRSDDEEIHKGLVVAKHQQIFVNASSKSDKAHKAIDDFFSGDLLNGAKELILGGVDELLGNYSVGENESEDMLILWENNALLRVDVYYWKWNFSSEGVVKVAQNVFAVYCVKRVINPEQVDPNVLIYAISRMCAKNKMKADEALDYVKKIMEKLKEVKEAINWKPPQITAE
jgi:hypothetical protein